MTDFSYSVDETGVATITWDIPDRSMNVLSQDGVQQLSDHVDAALADDAVRGVIITSGKDTFAAGMDLNVLARMREESGDRPAQGLFARIMQMHEVLRKIERAGMDPRTLKGGKPIAAALPGTALGIGYEIALACHRIFCADNPGARIGLPEILVGLFPGAGGTTRLIRKLGVMAAAPVLLEAKLSNPKAAKGMGLIDEVVDDPVAAARTWILNAEGGDLVKPWDRKGYRMPGGSPYHPSGYMTFVGAAAMVHGKTHGVYPAAKALLAAVYEGAQVPFDTALKIEARHFVAVLMNPSSSAMIRSLFINKQSLERGANRPAEPDQRVKRLGVLGAGMMGSGIALVSALAGIDVVLVDQTQETANKGKALTEAYMDKGIKRGKATSEMKGEVLSRITATSALESLEGADLIVEAVFEDPDIKAEITRRVETIVGSDCIFASNTSTLPISDLAKATAAPDRFIGIHFFSPVEKMRLVEIIKGRETGDRAVAKALDYVRQIRKTPIVVNDARFFFANRCIIPYVNEGIRMVAEGVAPILIENAARFLGFPLGPLQLVDETSIDLGARIARATKSAMGAAYPHELSDKVIFWMENEGRLGRKVQAGFYVYDDAGKREHLWDGLGRRYPLRDIQPELSEVQHRLLLVQVLEAVRAMEEGVLTDIREGDVGAVLGWGFAPWSGGPFSWLDMIGPAKAVGLCERLEAKCGIRFHAPELLRAVAAQGTGFYERRLTGPTPA